MAVSNPSHPNHHLSTLSSSGSNFSSQNLYLENSNLAAPRSSLSDSPTRSSLSGDSVGRQAQTYKHRQSTQSTSSPRASRTGLFTLAALARDKTSSAIANLSDPTLRTRISSSNLSRHSTISSSGDIPQSPSKGEIDCGQEEDQIIQSEKAEARRGSGNNSAAQPLTLRPKPSEPSSNNQRKSLLDTNPPSQSYENTETNTPSPVTTAPPGHYNKMHQTSSRLLRMTDDERPFTRVSVRMKPRLILC
jgi:GTPase-activating protein SST2